VGVAYFLMSEENVARQTALPYVSFGSDESGQAPGGAVPAVTAASRAPTATSARFLAKYVRDEKRTTLADAVRKLSALPAHNLGLHDRGMLKAGN
jgi:N-acyl-D-amino-acid deacylase